MLIDTPLSIVDILQQRATHTTEHLAFTYLADGDAQEEHLTYQQLHHRAAIIAGRLGQLAQKGERALLLFPQGLEFVAAFFGCLYQGVVAVPVAIPGKMRGPDKVAHIVADAGIRTALTSARTLEALRKQYPADGWVGQLTWIVTDAEGPPATAAPAHVPQPHDLAFLQYTSGSTGHPKGVMVSHHNLLANLAFIQRTYAHTEQSTSVCWTPSFHDMGLIDGILEPIFVGCRAVLLNPLHVIQKPIRWLRALCRYEYVHSGGPNFMFDLCVNRTTEAERASLDFSQLRGIYSAAEPIRYSTMLRFAAAFAQSGFRPEQLPAGYGLAESTLLVTTHALGHAPRVLAVSAAALEQGRVQPPTSPTEATRDLVVCGWPDPAASLRIVNPDTLALCPPDHIGEIWVAGPSVAQGYWNKPAQTAATFEAYTTTGEGPFLRTGDLGVLTTDGALCITGRLKDMLIVRGTNHYPSDLELTIEQSHAALQPNAGAVFSLDSEQGEQVVVLQEVKRAALAATDYTAVIDAIVRALSLHHGLAPVAVVLLRPGGVLKTTSGKVQRSACRQAYLVSSLPETHRWPSLQEQLN